MTITRVPRASAIVPAHQESTTIARCIRSLLLDEVPLDLVVSANACTDDTAVQARIFPARVLDLASPGKAAALDAADAVSQVLPRLYVDADIELRPGAVRALLEALDVPHARLAVPRRQLELTGASTVVRLYYRTWQCLQEVRGDLLGCGVYAVNAAGRARWGTFPRGIADDYHVHTRFSAAERVLVPEAVSVVRPPRTLRALIGVRARVYAGNVEHAQEHGVLDRPPARRELLLKDPIAVLGLPLYVLVTLLAKLAARRRIASRSTDWSRDATGRAA